MLSEKCHYSVHSLIVSSGFTVDDVVNDKFSEKYAGCYFCIDTLRIIFRRANVTPNKIGNFVALWKKDTSKEIGCKNIPYAVNEVDYCLIYTENQHLKGVFVFPNLVLAENGILSMGDIVGKLGFRLYPEWDQPTSNVARKTQSWQLRFFINLSDAQQIDYNKFKKIITQEVV